MLNVLSIKLILATLNIFRLIFIQLILVTFYNINKNQEYFE